MSLLHLGHHWSFSALLLKGEVVLVSLGCCGGTAPLSQATRAVLKANDDTKLFSAKMASVLGSTPRSLELLRVSTLQCVIDQQPDL